MFFCDFFLDFCCLFLDFDEDKVIIVFDGCIK